jgi:hypothetical protein
VILLIHRSDDSNPLPPTTHTNHRDSTRFNTVKRKMHATKIKHTRASSRISALWESAPRHPANSTGTLSETARYPYWDTSLRPALHQWRTVETDPATTWGARAHCLVEEIGA